MHEYMRRLDKALKMGIIDRGTVAHAHVGHDDWCGVYAGNDCNCDPDITIKCEDGVVMHVGKDGLARLTS